MRWFGHLIRMLSACLHLETYLSGIGDTGRPRTCQRDYIIFISSLETQWELHE